MRQFLLRVVVRDTAEPGTGATLTLQLAPTARLEVPQVSEVILKLTFDARVGGLQFKAWVEPVFVMVKLRSAPVSPTPIQP